MTYKMKTLLLTVKLYGSQVTRSVKLSLVALEDHSSKERVISIRRSSISKVGTYKKPYC